jgi:hypothetical protein
VISEPVPPLEGGLVAGLLFGEDIPYPTLPYRGGGGPGGRSWEDWSPWTSPPLPTPPTRTRQCISRRDITDPALTWTLACPGPVKDQHQVGDLPYPACLDPPFGYQTQARDSCPVPGEDCPRDQSLDPQWGYIVSPRVLLRVHPHPG